MYRNQILLATAITLSCLTLACGSKGPTDQQLTTDIQAKLYANDATKAANVNVAVKDGVVTLTGDVPSSDVELQAMKIANSAAGVKTVSDQMKLNDALAANSPPPAQIAPPPSEPAPMNPTPARPPKKTTPLPAAPAPVATSPAPDPAPPVQAAQVQDTQAPPPPAPMAPQDPPPPVRREPVTVTIPAGERLAIRMVDGIDSKVNTEGQTFRASLDAPLTSDGRVIVPVGAPVTVLLASAKGAGRIKGQSAVEVRVTSLRYRGQDVPVNTSVYQEQGSARGKQSAIRTGIGAAAGALIGGLAGGGKGAAIGSAAGGGAGIGVQALTHGQQVKIPSETPLTFRLEAPLNLTVKR
ncbi:MAG TPA: BON domain-containing protein [Bryobacteraceae bacterium]|nr:BON domain-containing protein [Bryobacteraceae bacterium]